MQVAEKHSEGKSQSIGTRVGMALLKKHLFIVCWCVFGSALIDLPPSTVLNNPSAGTDFFIPLIGAWDLHSGALHHSPLGVGFYLPYQFIGWLFGYGDWTVRYTQAMLFIAVSCIAWFMLNLRLGLWLSAVATAYLSLYATSPVNVSDSPFITYGSLHYDFLPIALGQLAILCAVFQSPRRALDLVVVCGLLFWEASIKINLAVMDIALVAAAFVLLRRDYLGAGLSVMVGGIMMPQLFNPDFVRASHARLQNLSGEPVQFLSQNLTWGLAGFWSRFRNLARDTFWIWSIPAVAIITTLSNIGKRAVPFAILLMLVVAVDAMRALSNSVCMTWPFTVLIVLAYLKPEK
jgi:hypothetical protein